MKAYRRLVAATLVAVLAAAQVQSQEATTPDQLLESTRQGMTGDNRAHQERLRQFEQQQAEQTRLLEEVRQRRAAEERRSDELEERFESNELLIREVQNQLDERLGALRELFGVLQQVSGDARSQFQNSVTNIEFPDRAEFLTQLAQRMGSTTRLASIEEIEQLWFELQREATELGKVKRLPNFRVITADGLEQFEDIVRVGAFNLVADGRYLRHNTETNSVSELQRQPSQRRFVNSTADLVRGNADSEGFVRFGVDITRGQLLSLLIETPNLRERIEQGQAVGYVIIGLGILGLLLSLERIISLSIASSKVSSQLKRSEPRSDNALGRVLQVYHNNRQADTETLELKLGEAILKEMPRLQRGILFIKIISVVAPLLGLLGTVIGMIITFQAITLYGTGDPRIMAGGISTALITTVLGLVVAIPMVLLHTLVNGRSRRIIQVLQEQSAGIIAERAEKSSSAPATA